MYKVPQGMWKMSKTVPAFKCLQSSKHTQLRELKCQVSLSSVKLHIQRINLAYLLWLESLFGMRILQKSRGKKDLSDIGTDLNLVILVF